MENKKVKQVSNAVGEKPKRRIKFKFLTKEELEKRRIPVYDYVI